MIHFLHDSWSQVTDAASFGFINSLQFRRKAGRLTLEDWHRYVAQYQNARLEDYCPVPDLPPPDLPDSGTAILPSPYPSGCRENDHLHADIWLGPKGWNSPMMFLLHGVMSVSDVGYRLWAKKLNALGWSAMFFHLPYHYGRRPAGALSGEMAISANFVRTAEGIRQAVIELRWICAALKQRGVPNIGLWATSYGGWVAGLLLGLEKNISTAWLLEPITDVDHVIWESPAARTIRWHLAREKITRDLTPPVLHLISPDRIQPVIPTDRILLVGGIFDRIAPIGTLRQLHGKWPGSRYAEYRQGHVGYQLMPASLKLAQEYYPELFHKS
jgi:hypothetical protein